MIPGTIADGSVAWQTANPAFGSLGAQMSTANGVAYGCSQDANGTMFALNGATGEVLWNFASGAACNAGAAIVDGTVYWATGYLGFTGPPAPGTVNVYVFSIQQTSYKFNTFVHMITLIPGHLDFSQMR